MTKRRKEGRGHYSAKRKPESGIRLLKGEDLYVLSCELGVTAAKGRRKV